MTADVASITELVARFDDAVNRRDIEEFGHLWNDEAVWEIGKPMPMRAEGRQTILDTWGKLLAGTTWLFRGSFAGVIELDGDEAWGRWPCIETGTFTDGRGYDNRAMYEDRYVRRSGSWKFAHRRYLYLWLSNECLPRNAVPLEKEVTRSLTPTIPYDEKIISEAEPTKPRPKNQETAQ